MKQVLGFSLLSLAAAVLAAPGASQLRKVSQHDAHMAAIKPLALVSKAGYPKDAPVDDVNMLATQEVSMYNEIDCGGNATSFTSSGNAAMRSFQPYIGNLWSVKLCGKGTFFYFATPDMQLLSTLGHVTRCGDDVSKKMEECECSSLPPETRHLVHSFTLQYC
mmetsp:Transcript_73457/g.192641  ORF Transcript_73457/g.192641 Transcript_73457/m.192641 type:complete len:163 (-) Transcript_73457:119-607(-)